MSNVWNILKIHKKIKLLRNISTSLSFLTFVTYWAETAKHLKKNTLYLKTRFSVILTLITQCKTRFFS